jgi:hypothetical protein
MQAVYTVQTITVCGTTPKKLNRQVIDFCRTINNEDPQYVLVFPSQKSTFRNCFNNVLSYVQERGGEVVYGWVIWLKKNVFIEAEAHAVWRDPDGDLIDITPHEDGERKIVFLPDPAMTFTGQRIRSKYRSFRNLRNRSNS